MPIASIESRRLYRQIADQIIRLIEDGEYLPGTRLPAERVLAVQLSVSRPSVREALIALEVEGWVDIRGGTGVFVLDRQHDQTAASAAPPSTLGISSLPPPGPIEVLNARDMIEPEIAALAARYATPEALAQMAQTMKDMVCCSAADQQHVVFDHQFHFSLAEATGNSALVMTMETLWSMRRSPLYLKLQDHFHNEAVWQRAIIEHREIFEAVRSKDPRAASAAMHRHLANARKRYISNWKDEG